VNDPSLANLLRDVDVRCARRGVYVVRPRCRVWSLTNVSLWYDNQLDAAAASDADDDDDDNDVCTTRTCWVAAVLVWHVYVDVTRNTTHALANRPRPRPTDVINKLIRWSTDYCYQQQAYLTVFPVRMDAKLTDG